MLQRKYNPWHITNSGEKECDKQLSSAEDLDEPFVSIHQLRLSSRYHRTQMAGEIDFLVITRLGIMVVEVKGGEIGYGERSDDGTGYYRYKGEGEKERMDNPFLQVDGNSDAIKKYLFQKELKNIFVGSMVCFPECEFERDGVSEDALWHRGYTEKLPLMILETLEAQIEDFRDNQINKGVKNLIQWSELEEEDMERICSALEPEFDPARYRKTLKINLEKNEERREQGLNILTGLEENERLIIQGPPGSGKTIFALHMIDRLCRKEGKKGIYICWNELLLEEMGQRLSESQLDIPDEQLRRVLYFDLIKEFAESTGDSSLLPTHEKVSQGLLRQVVKSAVSKLNNKKIQKYDFAIIDEAQDIFDKGLDIALKAILTDNNPLQKGNYYIFYDDSQDYPSTGEEMELYIRTRDAFKSYASSYTLSESLRAGSGHGIRELILESMNGKLDTDKAYGEDVSFKTWKDPADLISQLKQLTNQERIRGNIPNEEMIILFSADLLKKEHAVAMKIGEDHAFEKLSRENYHATSEKIRYTTMLKAKGLERTFVLLICSGPKERKDLYQVFVGASRAKAKVCLLLKKDDKDY